MKRYYIITIHCIHNFGSVFQSYALIRYLRSEGYDAKVIDYRPTYYSKGRNAMKAILSRTIHFIDYHKQHSKYERFISREMPKTSCEYHTIEELTGLDKEDAVFIAGGDQLWNSFHPCGRDDAYKLLFVTNKAKYALGTSMGRNSFSEEELKDIAQKIADFRYVGLREKSTVEMLRPYTNVPVAHISDPVLLLDKQDYFRFIGDKPLIKEPYLLMYLADKSELLEKTVSQTVRRLGLKVVHVCGFRKKCECDYFLKATGPEDLLNLIYYSKFVVSASFHATLFSLLFEKQFCTLLPEAGTNTRIEDLLSFFDISNRIVRNATELEQLQNNIDFNQVTPVLNRFAKDSREQINQILSNINQ